MLNDQLGAALRLLTERSFIATGNRTGCRSFEGSLACSTLSVKVRLEISDWDFLTYPVIKIIKLPEDFPVLLPHVDITGGLCYFASGSVVLDRYNPAIALAQCLDQATAILDKIATDPDYRKKDIQDEFLAHWIFGQKNPPFPVLKGTIEPSSRFSNYFILGQGDFRRAMIADDLDEVIAIASSLNTHPPVASKCKCWLLQTHNYPSIPESSLPNTIKELFNWLKIWDTNLYREIQRVLEFEQDYLKYSFITFVISSPAGCIGFGFDLDLIPHQAAKKTGGKRAPKLYKQHLHYKGGNKHIFRMEVTDISPSYVHSRNLLFPDLRDKKITLIGCGAIGSFLAQSLVRLGAGTGKSGELILIDQDSLEPDNLGRHYLGYPSLFQNKSTVLANELKRQFPLCHLTAKTNCVKNIPNLFSTDLIIDATGEEAVSEMLNELHTGKRSRIPPILYIWIQGNGDAVQSLWVDSKKYGCYRCLRLSDNHNYREERFKLLNKLPEQRFLGCRAFTPYAVSSPLNAAGLATDVIVDWLRGDPSPRFRTRSVETANVRLIKNQNISSLNNCPACQPS